MIHRQMELHHPLLDAIALPSPAHAKLAPICRKRKLRAKHRNVTYFARKWRRMRNLAPPMRIVFVSRTGRERVLAQTCDISPNATANNEKESLNDGRNDTQ